MKLAHTNSDGAARNYTAEEIYWTAPEGIYKWTGSENTRIIVLVRGSSRVILSLNEDSVEIVSSKFELHAPYVRTNEQLFMRVVS